MRKSKILLGALALTTAAPVMPLAITACSPKSEEVKNKLTFIAGEGGTISTGTKTIEIEANTTWGSITKPTPTAKSGYHFAGWYRGDTKLTDETVINETIDAYAWFEKDVAGTCYVACIPGPNVTFVGGTTQFLSVSSGTTWSDIKDQLPTITPSSDMGAITWYDDENVITDETVISSNLFAFAWAEPTDTTKVAVQFTASNGGTVTTKTGNYTKGQTLAQIGLPTYSANTGYKFEGWYINNEKVTEETVINSSCYVVAYFEKEKANFTLTAGEHGKVTASSKSIDVGRFNNLRWYLDQLAVPDDGYVLQHWEDQDGNVVDDTTRITNDMSLKAVFREQNYKFTYNETKNTCYVSGIEKDVEELIVPSYTWYNGKMYSVDGISDLCYKGNSTIKMVSLPCTFIYLGSWSFEACTALTKIILPDSIVKIWRGALLNCSALTEFKFCGTIAQYKAMERVATWHQGCNNFNSVWCVDGVTSIEDM